MRRLICIRASWSICASKIGCDGGLLRGDVDGSYAGAPGAQSLGTNQAGYFTALIAAHTDLSASQFGVYP